MTTELKNAPDLTKRAPRSPRVRLGGYVILPRILDKGRAAIAGLEGEYNFDGGLDQHWFRFTGVKAEDLRAELAKGKGDGEILAWVQENAPIKREAWEIKQWRDYFNERGPDSDAETLQHFAEKVANLSATREDIKTWFDLLDLDDLVSFGGVA